MTYEQYWYGDVWMVKAFREADKLKQQRTNDEAWLQGKYVYDAVSKLAPILHAFAKKGTKPQPYPEKPYEIDSSKTSVNQEQLAENERLKAAIFFKNWAKAAGRKFQK